MDRWRTYSTKPYTTPPSLAKKIRRSRERLKAEQRRKKRNSFT